MTTKTKTRAKAGRKAVTGAKAASRAAREAALAPGVVIKKVGSKAYDLSDYDKVKSAGGNTSLDCGDPIAKSLRGMEIEDVYKTAAKKLDVSVKALKERYKHLNVGMQRMNLGNKIRAASAN